MSRENLEEEVLYEFVVGLRGVKIGAGTRNAGELWGWYKGVVEDVELLDLIVVEKYKEGSVLEQCDDIWVKGD